MESKKLRIGNYVNSQIFGIVSVWELHNVDIFVALKSGGTISSKYNTIEPIPLTEEWLLKFGIFGYGHTFDYLDGIYPNATIRIERSDNCFDILVGSDEYRIAKIQYVHQLQNLYFALTGQELSISKDSKETN